MKIKHLSTLNSSFYFCFIFPAGYFDLYYIYGSVTFNIRLTVPIPIWFPVVIFVKLPLVWEQVSRYFAFRYS